MYTFRTLFNILGKSSQPKLHTVYPLLQAHLAMLGLVMVMVQYQEKMLRTSSLVLEMIGRIWPTGHQILLWRVFNPVQFHF